MKSLGQKWQREALRKVIPIAEKLHLKRRDIYVTPHEAWKRLKKEKNAIIQLYYNAFTTQEERHNYLMTALEQDIRSFKQMLELFEIQPHFDESLREIAAFVAKKKPSYLLLIPPHFFEVNEKERTALNQDILLIAIQHDVDFGQYLPEELLTIQSEFAKKALEIQPAFVKFVPDVSLAEAAKAFASDNRVAALLPEHLAKKVLDGEGFEKGDTESSVQDDSDTEEHVTDEPESEQVSNAPHVAPSVATPSVAAPSVAAPSVAAPSVAAPSVAAPSVPAFAPSPPLYPDLPAYSPSAVAPEAPYYSGHPQKDAGKQTVQIQNGAWTTTVTTEASLYPPASSHIVIEQKDTPNTASSSSSEPSSPPPRPPRPSRLPSLKPSSNDPSRIAPFKSSLNKQDIIFVKHIARVESHKVALDVLEEINKQHEEEALLETDFEAWQKARSQRLRERLH
jgi:hypothetical protein